MLKIVSIISSNQNTSLYMYQKQNNHQLAVNSHNQHTLQLPANSSNQHTLQLSANSSNQHTHNLGNFSKCRKIKWFVTNLTRHKYNTGIYKAWYSQPPYHSIK